MPSTITVVAKELEKEIGKNPKFSKDINLLLSQTKRCSDILRNLSKICGISLNKINLKGKTSEKLGLIGKEKAIACEVITSVTKYD